MILLSGYIQLYYELWRNLLHNCIIQAIFIYHCIMQQIITPYDFALLPIYLFIFYFIVRKKSKKYKILGLKNIFIIAFILRMAGSVFYSLLIQYYYGYGDSFGFYLGGNVLSHMICGNMEIILCFLWIEQQETCQDTFLLCAFFPIIMDLGKWFIKRACMCRGVRDYHISTL